MIKFRFDASQPRFFTAVLIAGVFLASAAAPALAAVVAGVVTDAETGKPLEYVTVQVIGYTSREGKLNRGGMCGLDGRYELSDIPLGSYVIRISRIGYTVREDSIEIDTNRRYLRDFRLIVEPVELDKITVEASRHSRDIKIQTGFVSIEAAELAELPGIVESDPIRSLQLLPGVQAASDISSGLYIRGGGPDQTEVLLDGVPVYNPTHAFGFFSAFNADALTDMNLYKGAYPAQYGGRLGAVLDATTNTGNRKEVRGKAGVSAISARVTAEGPVSGGSWMASGRRTYIEPVLNAVSDPENPLPSYYFYDINACLSSARTNRGTLILRGYLGRDNVDYVLDADSEIDMVWGNTLLSADYETPLGDHVLAGARFAVSRYVSDTDVRIFSTPFSIDNRLQDMTFGGDFSWQGGAAHRISGGAEGTQYNIFYQQSFNDKNELDYRRTVYEAAAFVEDEWSFPGGTALRTGVRCRYIDDGGQFLIEPRFSGVRPVSSEIKLKAGAGLYHQYLQMVTTEGFSAADFYVPLDETVAPARAWHSVLGLEWEPSATYKLSAEGYYTALEDLVMMDNSSLPDRTGLTAEQIFYTGGTGYQAGVELFAERKSGRLTGWVGYTLGFTRRQFAEINNGETFPPKYDRRHDASAVLKYRAGKWKFGANFIYATGQAFTPASALYQIYSPATEASDLFVLAGKRNSSRLLPYHRLDVSAGRDFRLFGKNMEGYVQIFNLYSRRNDWFVQYDIEDYSVDPVVVKQLPLIPSIGINFEF